MIYLYIKTTNSQLDTYEFGVHMKDWAEDIDLGNHQPMGECWGHGGRGYCQGESKEKRAIYLLGNY